MANPPWTTEEMKYHKAYSGNLTTPSESSSLKSQSGIAMNWTSEEDERLVQLLDSYSSESSGAITRYSKIAAGFENKTIRDVAVRSRWIYKKIENAKRRKEDHNGLGRARVDNKEIIDMVVASQVFQPSQHETWKHMPPLPEKLNDELFCDLYKAISPSANLP
ncbi:Homeobox-like domain superfamily [Arabidopsis thaliana x Arabidopsis arenosa]|uniref:Homeobox-like domain superfamily n=1 Tax=Arabidopsis thaliana x Arabidopsis arenosa TaxID=1240361 RepID=A0A8T2A9X8_9BRAS|nr:Homeobox-like domain superfamily [Arabidopsis thaliana x Arabidopsis arenosa]